MATLDEFVTLATALRDARDDRDAARVALETKDAEVLGLLTAEAQAAQAANEALASAVEPARVTLGWHAVDANNTAAIVAYNTATDAFNAALVNLEV